MKVKQNFPRGRVAFFATSNIHKFNEARCVLAEYKIATCLLRIKALEIQDNNIENIAKASVLDIVNKYGLPVMVEDTGLFIEALNGFPGPYSSYVYKTIGNQGILQLMRKVEMWDAYFHSVVSFCMLNEKPKFFHGRVRGKISHKECGNLGFGFDPIFQPLGGEGKTFAEMTTKQKSKYSHRARAFRKFARWYTSTI